MMYNDNKEVFSCPAVSGAANRACYSIPSGDWSVVAINDRNEAKFPVMALDLLPMSLLILSMIVVWGEIVNT